MSPPTPPPSGSIPADCGGSTSTSPVRRRRSPRRLAGRGDAQRRDGASARPTASADLETGADWAADTIARLYSMTKPITSVAAMILYEEGQLQLKDPVAKYIPAFADTPVYRNGSFQAPVTEAQTEPMRIWHLLTHTSGLTYGFHNTHATDAIYRKAGFEWGIPAGLDLEACCDAWAALPSCSSPGREWNYGVSTDVLGPGGRGRVRSAARRVLPRANPRPARDERHRVLGPGATSATGSPSSTPETDRQRSRRSARCLMPTLQLDTSRRCSAAVAACAAPQPTTCASRRCCSTAVSSTVSASSDRARSTT